MQQPFLFEWRAAFGNSLPAGFLCRAEISERWLRIHSLPGAQRYAESDAECAELLRRQNLAAMHVLGDGARCMLLITCFGDSVDWPAHFPVSLGGQVPEHVLSAEFDGDGIQFFALPVIWRINEFDDLILALADGKTGPVLIADVQRRRIYAPYEGGADLFFPNQQAVEAARLELAPLLSHRADGL